jgi:hypothetical protein
MARNGPSMLRRWGRRANGTEGTGSRNNNAEAVTQECHRATGSGSMNDHEPNETVIQDTRGAEGYEPIQAVSQEAQGTEETRSRNHDESIEAINQAEVTESRNYG